MLPMRVQGRILNSKLIMPQGKFSRFSPQLMMLLLISNNYSRIDITPVCFAQLYNLPCRNGWSGELLSRPPLTAPHRTSRIDKVGSEWANGYLEDEVESFWKITQKPHSDHRVTETFHAFGGPVGVHLGEAQSCLYCHRHETNDISKHADVEQLKNESKDCHGSCQSQKKRN